MTRDDGGAPHTKTDGKRKAEGAIKPTERAAQGKSRCEGSAAIAKSRQPPKASQTAGNPQ